MPLANQSHGDIIDYEVTWAKTTERGRPNRTKVAHTKTSLALSLEATEEYIITVTARNINGSSPPSTITIPRRNPGMKPTHIWEEFSFKPVLIDFFYHFGATQ